VKFTAIYHADAAGGVPRGFRTAVSLHGHTLHSHETLEGIVRLAYQVPVLASLVRRMERRYLHANHRPFSGRNAWWTPPLTARAAYELEAGFIANSLGLQPLVSLSDHDTIEAPLALRVLRRTRDVPVSVEWSVPWGETFFHLGVHNMPAARAQAMMAAMASYTVSPRPEALSEILDWLTEDPGVLVVLNHPLWDEAGVGVAGHREAMSLLVGMHRGLIHALEANGMRPAQENAETAEHAARFGLPVISGGDRHGREPSAALNLTNASTFSEFVSEIRFDRVSRVYFAAHGAESRTLRIYREVCEVLREDPSHGLGWVKWSDRVFYRTAEGEVKSVSRLWNGEQPHVIRCFVSLVRLLDYARIAPAVRTLRGVRRESAL
jgi:hypothetical protein